MQEQLAFLLEIDKLKSIVRKSPLIDRSRRENSAEHSWHLAMYALVLADTANTPVAIDRVVRMLLIHDIVEIDAGDHPIHETTDTDIQKELERKAAARLFGLLPGDQGDALLALWQEFEAGESADAVFAKSLDRMQPLLHNVATGGGTWVEANLAQGDVVKRYGPTISAGSTQLWKEAERRVEAHFEHQPAS